MSWCDLSVANILPSRTRSGKGVVRVTHAFRIGERVIIRYSTGVLRLMSEKNICGVENLPRLRFATPQHELEAIHKIWDGRITLEDIKVIKVGNQK